MSTCPSLDDLRRLDSEAIDDDVFADLERHLEHCVPCREALERQLFERLRDVQTTRLIDSGTPPMLPPPLPGYRIDRELGRGGMGIVYLATREADGQQVALKYLGGGPSDRARWRREAEAMRRIDHPGVVRLLDSSEVGGWVCLVMEYVAGGNLEDRLDGATPPETAARVVEIIARAIEEVHGAELLHLDLKPSNILLGGTPDLPLDRAIPMVADFGLALSWGDPDATWTMAAGPRGTPSYMAPEQLAPARSTLLPPADVYALGAILYRMLAARPPFLAPTKMETYLQLRDREPVPLRRLNPEVPRDLETICLACLRKEPHARYPSARALADDLGRFLRGEPIDERPTPPPVLAYRWCRRNRTVAGLSVALVMALLALVFVQSARLRSARVDRDRVEAARLQIQRERDLADAQRITAQHERDRAEAQRIRAEANRRLSSGTLQSIVWMTDQMFASVGLEDPAARDLLAMQVEALYRPLHEDYLAGTIDDERLLRLGFLATAFAGRLAPLGQDEQRLEMLAVARSALRSCVRNYPEMDECRWILVQALADSASSVAQRYPGGLEEAIAYIDEAESLCESIDVDLYTHGTIFRVITAKLLIAQEWIDRGDEDAARSYAQGVRRDFETSACNLPYHPWQRAEYAVVLANLGDEDAAVEIMRAIFAGVDPPGWQDDVLMRCGAHWIQRQGGPLLALLDQDPRAFEDSLGGLPRLLRDEWDRIGVPIELDSTFPVRRSLHLDHIANRVWKRLSALRLRKQAVEVQRLVDNLLGLAEHLAEADPDDLDVLCFLHLAMIQKAKNGYFENSPSEVLRWTARSEEPLTRAIELEPTHPRLLGLVRDCEPRLAKAIAFATEASSAQLSADRSP